MKKHRTKSERIRLHVESFVQEVEGLELQLSLVTERISFLKTSLPQRLRSLLSRLSPHKAEKILYRLYWVSPHFAGLVKDVFQSLSLGKFQLPKKRIETECQLCGEETSLEVKSWSEFKEKSPLRSGKLRSSEWNWILCDTCKEEKKRSKEARDKDLDFRYRERREAESRELEWLRTMPYPEYLQTAHWQQVRIRALKRSGFRCQLCNKEGRLNVHHRTYERRGYEYYNDVITLCESCHEKFHDILPQEGGQS